MKTITKAFAGTVAAGALAMTSAAPAFARDHHKKGIDAGEVIAGAVILGGIAAIIASSKKDRYNDRYNGSDYRYDNRSQARRGNGHLAVERCVQAAENQARRNGYRTANVTQIRDVDRKRNGWRVKGSITVDTSRGYSNSRYDRRDRRAYRQDSGKFTCDFSSGRILDLDYSGIRGLG